MTSSHVTSFGGYKNPKKMKRILDSTTTYEKYLLSLFSVWAILVWEYWNPPKICNKKVTTRLWYTAGPYWHTFGGIGPRAKALGPILPKVCQYGPLAYHTRVITYNYNVSGIYIFFCFFTLNHDGIAEIHTLSLFDIFYFTIQ